MKKLGNTEASFSLQQHSRLDKRLPEAGAPIPIVPPVHHRCSPNPAPACPRAQPRNQPAPRRLPRPAGSSPPAPCPLLRVAPALQPPAGATAPSGRAGQRPLSSAMGFIGSFPIAFVSVGLFCSLLSLASFLRFSPTPAPALGLGDAVRSRAHSALFALV